ncbi:hypothetical protein EYF80_021764 [Liparis tanakae]|uniref:Transmembrane protein n=1 Tax=Liparis tanakae TaxID=230148 RepID=A0A4Z2HT03_9TELE|nr:hypothetical protein EYF80_021764 [Liparis tanakae]
MLLKRKRFPHSGQGAGLCADGNRPTPCIVPPVTRFTHVPTHQIRQPTILWTAMSGNLAALNFDSFFGACWGGATSGATSSCLRSRMVGRAGAAMAYCLHAVTEIKDYAKKLNRGFRQKTESERHDSTGNVWRTSNRLAGRSGTAVGLSSSAMPSLVSLGVVSSWLKLRPVVRRSSKSAALLSLVSLHTLFSRLRDFRMDFLGTGSPFFTCVREKDGRQTAAFLFFVVVVFIFSVRARWRFAVRHGGPARLHTESIFRRCSISLLLLF